MREGFGVFGLIVCRLSRSVGKRLRRLHRQSERWNPPNDLEIGMNGREKLVKHEIDNGLLMARSQESEIGICATYSES